MMQRAVALFDVGGHFVARVEIPTTPLPAYVVAWEGRTFVCADTKPEHYREAIAIASTTPPPGLPRDGAP